MQRTTYLAIHGTTSQPAPAKRRLWLPYWVLLPSLALPAAPPQQWGAPADGLQLSIAAAERAAPSMPAFAITFRNLGPRDANVFLGTGAVGYQSPERIQLSVIDAARKQHDFSFVDRRYAGIAGGLTYFVVPLPSKRSHTLKFNLDDFWVRDMTRNAASLQCPCLLTAVFEGISVTPYWASIELPPLWVGTLRSNTLELLSPGSPQ